MGPVRRGIPLQVAGGSLDRVQEDAAKPMPTGRRGCTSRLGRDGCENSDVSTTRRLQTRVHGVEGELPQSSTLNSARGRRARQAPRRDVYVSRQRPVSRLWSTACTMRCGPTRHPTAERAESSQDRRRSKEGRRWARFATVSGFAGDQRPWPDDGPSMRGPLPSDLQASWSSRSDRPAVERNAALSSLVPVSGNGRAQARLAGGVAVHRRPSEDSVRGVAINDLRLAKTGRQESASERATSVFPFRSRLLAADSLFLVLRRSFQVQSEQRAATASAR